MFTFDQSARSLSRLDLRSIPIPVREDVSARWKGIGHGDLADTIVQAAHDNGLHVKKESWHVAGSGADLFGSIDFLRDDVPAAPGGFVYSLGVMHSNRSLFALRLAVGGKVLVCGNGMTSGVDANLGTVRRKHTTGLKLHEAVNAGMLRWIEHLGTVGRTVGELTALDLSGSDGYRHVNDVLIEMGRRDVLPWSALGKVDEEWRNPRHQEFSPRTGWSLYNAATETIKAYSPSRQIRTMDVTSRLILTPNPRDLVLAN